MDMDEEPAHADLRSAFEELLEALIHGRSWQDIHGNEFYRILCVRASSWKFFGSDRGYLGITYPTAEVDDFVCLVPGCRKAFMLESLIWRHLDHEYVLPFLGIADELSPGTLCMVTPLMENGNIREYIQSLETEYLLVTQVYNWVTPFSCSLAIKLMLLWTFNSVQAVYF